MTLDYYCVLPFYSKQIQVCLFVKRYSNKLRDDSVVLTDSGACSTERAVVKIARGNFALTAIIPKWSISNQCCSYFS